jgi:hypothetical protein
MTEDAYDKGDVGSLGEEAAKLFAAAAAWAREHAGDVAGPAAAAGSAAGTDSGDAAGSGAASRLGEWLSADHIATGAPECTWCPLCQAIGVLRSTSPEIKEHLASLVVVARQLLDSVADAAQESKQSSPDVEHIDLSEDDSWD